MEVKSMLHNNRERTQERVHRSLRAFCDNWHDTDKTVFDKSRAWAANSIVLKTLYPESKMVVLVRDLRNVFASVEKQHRNTPLFDECPVKTIYARADQMFAPGGLIGGPLVGIEDLLRIKPDGVIYLQYENLVAAPADVMVELYKDLGLGFWEHDFEDVINTAEDPDGFYLWKYPHEGKGKVEACNPDEYQKYLSPDLATTIMDRFKDFNDFFGYR